MRIQKTAQKAEKSLKKDIQLVSTLSAVAGAYTHSDPRVAQCVRAYASHLVDPEHTKAVGIPTQVIGMTETGLINSTMAFDVTVNFSASSQPGRFGFVVKPTMGSSASAPDFKVALVNTTTTWPTDFSSSLSYRRNVGTQTLTVDPVSKTMIQGPATFYQANALSAPAASGSPLGSQATLVVSNSTDDPQNPAFGAVGWIYFPVALTGAMLLPPGQWSVDLNVGFVANIAVARNFVLAVQNGSASISKQWGQSTVGMVQATYIISVYGKSATIYFTWDAQPSQDYNVDVSILSSWARPDQLANPAVLGYPLDGGPINEYVPVAMSVLTTFVAPDLTIGGDIATALLPPEACAVDVFSSMPTVQVGNPLNVESLRRFPGKYDGKLRDGTYCIWRPSSVEDMEPRSPGLQNSRAWPCIAVSGLANSASATGTQTILRVTISTTYQFKSALKLWPMEMRFGSIMAQEDAMRIVMTFPCSSANGEHWENIKAMFRRLGVAVKNGVGWINDNKSWLQPAATGMLSLL